MDDLKRKRIMVSKTSYQFLTFLLSTQDLKLLTCLKIPESSQQSAPESMWYTSAALYPAPSWALALVTAPVPQGACSAAGEDRKVNHGELLRSEGAEGKQSRSLCERPGLGTATSFSLFLSTDVQGESAQQVRVTNRAPKLPTVLNWF